MCTSGPVYDPGKLNRHLLRVAFYSVSNQEISHGIRYNMQATLNGRNRAFIHALDFSRRENSYIHGYENARPSVAS